MNKFLYINLDLEATCWKAEDIRPANAMNEIIEIGAVAVDETGKQLGTFNQFIKPITSVYLSDFCKELTTIAQEDIDDAKNFGEVENDFQNWYESFGCTNVVFVSWGHYDKNQFIKDCNLYGIDTKWIDAPNKHISLKHLHGEWNKLKKGGIGLGSACKFEKITFEGTAHRGICDALMVSKIFCKYLDRVNSMFFDDLKIDSSVNYHQVVEGSQFFDDLEQILTSLKSRAVPIDYIMVGIQNTIDKGYEITKSVDLIKDNYSKNNK